MFVDTAALVSLFDKVLAAVLALDKTAAAIVNSPFVFNKVAINHMAEVNPSLLAADHTFLATSLLAAAIHKLLEALIKTAKKFKYM